MPAPDSIIEMAARLQVDAASLHHAARAVHKSMGDAITGSVDQGMKASYRLIKRGLERAASASDFAKKMLDARKTRKELVDFAGKVGDWFGKGYTKAQKVFFDEVDKYRKRSRRKEQEHEDLMHDRRRQAAQEIESFRKKELEEQIETYGRGMTGVLETLKSGELAGLAGIVGAAGRAGVTRGRAWQAAGEAGDAGKLQKAMAKLGKGMVAVGKTLAVVGATAGVLAIIVKLLVEIADGASIVKKSFLEMGGAVAMGRTSVAALDRQMEAFYKTVYEGDFKTHWSLVKDEMIGVTKAMADAGMHMARLRAQTKAGASVMGTLKDNIGFAVTYATMFGKQIDEVGRDMATLSFETGLSMETIAHGMAEISEITRVAGFDAKRFYGTVLEVTSGMGIYSRRVEEAAGMLKTLSHILGETVGADFLKGIERSFKDMPITQRIQFVAMAGTENVMRLMKDAAERQGRAVEETLADMVGQEDKRALAIVKAFGGSADKVAEAIEGMTKEEYRAAEAKALRVGGPGTAELLKELTRLRRLQEGAVDERKTTLALQDWPATHKLLGQLFAAMRPLGGIEKNIDRLNDIEALASEAGWSMSVEQLHTLQDLVGRSQAGWKDLENATGKVRKQLAEQYGLTVKDGKLQEKGSGKLVESFTDFLIATATLEKDTKKQTDLLTDQANLAKGIRDKTEGMSKDIENLKDELIEKIQIDLHDLVTTIPGKIEDLIDAIDSITGKKGTAKGDTGEEYQTASTVGAALKKGTEGTWVQPVIEALGTGEFAVGQTTEQAVQAGLRSAFEAWALRPTRGTEEEKRQKRVEWITGETISEDPAYLRMLEKLRGAGMSEEMIKQRSAVAIDLADLAKEQLLAEHPGAGPFVVGGTMAGAMAPVLLYGREAGFTGPEQPAGDFVVTDRGDVIKADPRDTIVGFRGRAGGPGAGAVYVNIYGGDRREVYETVRQALRVARVATA